MHAHMDAYTEYWVFTETYVTSEHATQLRAVSVAIVQQHPFKGPFPGEPVPER